MAGHTPGPWELSDDGFLLEIRMGTALEDGCSYETQHVIELPCIEHCSEEPDDSPGNKQAIEAWANARLIAAAPDLLGVCKKAFAAMVASWGGKDEYEEEILILQAAIAKAEGK